MVIAIGQSRRFPFNQIIVETSIDEQSVLTKKGHTPEATLDRRGSALINEASVHLHAGSDVGFLGNI